ncbi:Rieske (2Fe-2S) domain-containing protein [Caballeronia sordidicola]|uniref:Rieske (2Fe-2S) domain-containing protein n=1 Tax=Caballeronia sordidicola TaxID=196367 RepID=A0A158G650_CABSO|nr:aromatic ring-hydroxylating dioxygenase subunit alpha [Caballeronia sordidicola]SAL27373.1 Rieske (2Fe-2S) domain-containing protein [Caballeronia sordidicola]
MTHAAHTPEESYVPMTGPATQVRWPRDDVTRVPLRIFADAATYAREQDAVFRGPTWSFLCLEVEIPNAGDYVTTKVGETSVIVVRTADGSIHALVNKCVHKGSVLCYEARGHRARPNFVCPYHNWVYSFDGRLTSVAFENGVQGKGGMPEDFDKAAFHLTRLRVDAIRGIVFGSFSSAAPELRDYLGPVMVSHIERTIYGRLKILGRYSQVMHNNWKLYVENSRDNYHPSLLHAFFSTFKINRLSAEGGTLQDDQSRHHITFTKRFTDVGDKAYDSGVIRAMRDDFGLKDPSLIDQWMEYPDQITNAIQSIFPGFVLHQIMNSLGVRQVVPLAVDRCELIWTVLGFEEDSEEQTLIRRKQSNLVGPAGYVSMEDGTIGAFVEKGIRGDLDDNAVIEMGGKGVGPMATRATETSVRGFWKFYRELMNV